VEIATFDEAADGEVVRVVGKISTGSGSATIGGYGALILIETGCAECNTIWVYVRIGSGTPPPPNSMSELPSFFKKTDLVLTAEDGTVLHTGDAVALTGTVKQEQGLPAELDHVTRIEVASRLSP
jgi:hypothetical protein